MIAQILLTIALAAIFLYGMAQRPKLLVFRAAIGVLCLGGLLVVWVPDLSTNVAHQLGIGRGADLISYMWILTSLVIAINVHVRLRLESERVTALAREVALLNATEPGKSGD